MSSVLSAPVVNTDLLSDLARVVLEKLDPPKRKRDVPVRPGMIEILGPPKSGKDTQLVNLDRWFRRHDHLVLIEQESAEQKDIRRMSKGINPYVYEMTHFSYTFANFVKSITSRDFTIVSFNRGFIDTLCWLELHRRNGKLTTKQFKKFKSWILNGPWVANLDVVLNVTCSVDVMLKREYGDVVNPVYGSRMNPEFLTLFKDCVDTVIEDVGSELPKLSVFTIDTSDTPVKETSNQIISHILESLKNRFGLTEDEIRPFSPTLLRKSAREGNHEVKFRGKINLRTLSKNAWLPVSVGHEVDIYLKPKNRVVLENDECFHIRDYGAGNENCHLIYKKGKASSPRLRVSVPILRENISDFFSSFDKVTVVEKERRVFARDGMIINVDMVEGLGEFIEIKGNSSVDLVGEAVKLGLTENQIEPETYLHLFLKKKFKI